jgi:hypothetical protein
LFNFHNRRSVVITGVSLKGVVVKLAQHIWLVGFRAFRGQAANSGYCAVSHELCGK